MGVAVAVVIVLLSGYMILRARSEAWKAAKTNSETLMLALRRDIERDFLLLDLSLQGAHEALAGPGIQVSRRGLLLHAVFDQSASVEDVAAVMVVDATGRITLHSKLATSPAANVADRDYFVAQRDNPGLGLFVSRVYRSRLRANDPSIALSRRLQTDDGRFDGIVVGALRLDYFKRLFQNLQLGPHGTLTLFSTDGHIVMRYPMRDEDIDRDISAADSTRRMIAGGNSGCFVAVAAIDGVNRLYTYTRVGTLPLILAVNLSVDDIYANWQTQAFIIGPVLVLLCLSTLGLTVLFCREVGRRSAAERRLLNSSRELAVMAATDGLTGLGNRRTMEAEVQDECQRALRTGNPIALLMLDVDHFKLYNDRYGHPEGDDVLRRVSRGLQGVITRPADTVSRYGGEEFVILLPNTDERAALAVAERVRASVEALAITHEASPIGVVTISIGAAVWYPALGDADAGLLKLADLALYKAKHAGRNRVRLTISGRPPHQLLHMSPADASVPG